MRARLSLSLSRLSGAAAVYLGGGVLFPGAAPSLVKRDERTNDPLAPSNQEAALQISTTTTSNVVAVMREALVLPLPLPHRSQSLPLGNDADRALRGPPSTFINCCCLGLLSTTILPY